LDGSHLGVELMVKMRAAFTAQFNTKSICPAWSRSSGFFVAYVLCLTQRPRATLSDDHPNLLTKERGAADHGEHRQAGGLPHARISVTANNPSPKNAKLPPRKNLP
jgi:hypothetical protein